MEPEILQKLHSISAAFEAKIVIKAFKGIGSTLLIERSHELHPMQVIKWKNRVRSGSRESSPDRSGIGGPSQRLGQTASKVDRRTE
jgi:hypothetical protein